VSYTRVAAEVYETALRCARGCYQRALIEGSEAWSGGTLRGKAARYVGRYRVSAANLRERLEAAGLFLVEVRGKHNRRELYIFGSGEAARAALAASALGASALARSYLARARQEVEILD
jgi:hypothetical protein